MSNSVIHMSNSVIHMSNSVIHMSNSVIHMSNSVLSFPRARPRPVPRGPRAEQKSTMAEFNKNDVIDLISMSTDDDDSSIDSYYDSFVLQLLDNGGVLVRDKVIMIDMDDETTSRTTATTCDGILDLDSSYCSSHSLSEDSCYYERASRPSKQPQDLSARYVSSRVFLAAAIVVPATATRQSIVSAASGSYFFRNVVPTILLIIVNFYVCVVLSFERWSAQLLFDAVDPNVVVHFYVRS
jgi:hypothetical protein